MAAAFVTVMVGVVLALHGKLHALNVEHEARKLAEDLSSSVERAGNSQSQLSIERALQEKLGGHEYTVTIDNDSVAVAVPSLNISQRVLHGTLRVSSSGPFKGGDVLLIVGAQGEVTVSKG